MPQKIHAFWMSDKPLNELAILTINSFIKYGVEFHIWIYDNLNGKIPENVILNDASDIISKKHLFTTPSTMYLNFGQNSYAPFSDLFRYKLMYKLGGWYTDFDITCLTNIEDITEPYWFRFHGVLDAVQNIFKCPPKSELMEICYKRALLELGPNQKDWHVGIKIFCETIQKLNLKRFITYDRCNLDKPEFIDKYIKKNVQDSGYPSSEWFFIHWMNSSFLPKKGIYNSYLDYLMKEYKIIKNNNIFF